MSDLIETLMHANLIEVFNERDEARRHAAVERSRRNALPYNNSWASCSSPRRARCGR